ncbi:MAG: DNA-3-methyladenine glycosylase 2 family protein [Kineosporiaceae bacterium]
MTAEGPEQAERVWRPGFPVDVPAILGSLRRGPSDPCYRDGGDGTVWRATRTPDGPVLLRVRAEGTAGPVRARAWGPGTGWALDGLPELLGARDDPAGFCPDPAHPVLVDAYRRFPGWRVPRTRAVFEALTAAALEQRVTGAQARTGWRALLLRFGEPAPGPASDGDGPAAGMRVPPSPAQWAAIPTWEWLSAGVEQARSRVVVGAAGRAGRLEALIDLPAAQAADRLRSVPGVGVWTAAEVGQRAHGDPDAFSWGDYHAARDVSWALTGRVLDEPGCATELERYRGHRYRVQRLLELAGVRRPRRGPRLAVPSHLPVRPPPGAGPRRRRW